MQTAIGGFEHAARRPNVNGPGVGRVGQQGVYNGVGETAAAQVPTAAGIDALKHSAFVQRAGRAGKVARTFRAGHVSAAGAIHRDAIGRVITRPAQVGGVNQVGAGGVELGHDGVTESSQRGLNGVGYREIPRGGPTADGGVGGGIDGDAGAKVGAAPAKVGRVNQRHAVGAELAHKKVGLATIPGLHRVGHRKTRSDSGRGEEPLTGDGDVGKPIGHADRDHHPVGLDHTGHDDVRDDDVGEHQVGNDDAGIEHVGQTGCVPTNLVRAARRTDLVRRPEDLG